MFSGKVNLITDPLQEVSEEELPKLFLSLQHGYPQTVHENVFLRCLLRWKRLRPEIDLHIFAPDGKPSKGVFFYALFKGGQFGTVYVEDLKAMESLKVALKTTKRKLFQKNMDIEVTCLRDINLQSLEDVIKSESLGVAPNTIFWMPWYKAREVKIHLPDGVELCQLERKHADEVDKYWPHRYPGSNELIAEMIEINGGVGVFRKDKLLSWAVHWFYGAIGVVQTLQEEKRKGYGKAVVEALVKRIGDMQIDVHICVVKGNAIAEDFFRPIGFEFAHASSWVYRSHST